MAVKMIKILAWLSGFIACSLCADNSSLKTLYDFLFEQHLPAVRPVLNASDVVYVDIVVKLRQVVKLETKEQYITLAVWVTQYWLDELLYWDPVDFDNIDQIVVPYDRVWTPDTNEINPVNMDSNEVWRGDIPVTLYSVRNVQLPDGRIVEKAASIKRSFPATYAVNCFIDVEKFPWDKQTCNLTLSSWTHNSKQIKYNRGEIRLENSLINLEWHLVGATSTVEENKYSMTRALAEEKEAYSETTFTFVLERKSDFFLITLIVPTFILVESCLVGIFTLSSSEGERSEKTTLAVTTILALSVLMLVIGDIMPRASRHSPKINHYFLMNMILMGLALLASCLLLYFQHFTKCHPNLTIPTWLNRLACIRHPICFRSKKCRSSSSNNTLTNCWQKNNRSSLLGLSLMRHEDVNSCRWQLVDLKNELKRLNDQLEVAVNRTDMERRRAVQWQALLNKLELCLFLLFAIWGFSVTALFVYTRGHVYGEFFWRFLLDHK